MISKAVAQHSTNVNQLAVILSLSRTVHKAGNISDQEWHASEQEKTPNLEISWSNRLSPRPP